MLRLMGFADGNKVNAFKRSRAVCYSDAFSLEINEVHFLRGYSVKAAHINLLKSCLALLFSTPPDRMISFLVYL